MSPNEETREKKKLLGGVLLLLPATVFTKLVGLFYKIPLIAIVGVSGMAYFLAAYHIYSLLFVLSATGLPTALSLAVARAVSEGKNGAVGRVFGVAMALFLSLGALGTAALIFCAPQIAARLAMADAAASIVAIAPALLLSAFVGGVKGYFQGFHRMLPTALCEVIEASGKLLFGLGLAMLAKGRGLPTPTVAAYAIFGITAGLAVAALVLLCFLAVDLFRRRGASVAVCAPARLGALAQLLRTALPITLSASVMSVVTLIDTALISGRLQAVGFSPDVANAMYSSYGNLAVPLYNLVPALLMPITLSLMPLLGGAMAGGRGEAGRAALRTALRLSLLLSAPAALGLGVFARPILSLVYRGQNEAIAIAAPLLSLLALSVLPAALVAVMGAALQATGHTAVPVFAMGAGALVKLGTELLLLPVSGVYIYAAPISTLACHAVVLVIECIALSKALPFDFLSCRDLLPSFLAAVIGVSVGGASYLALLQTGAPNDLLMLPVLPLTALVFAWFSLRFGAVGKDELLALPAGEKLCRFLEKHNFIK